MLEKSPEADLITRAAWLYYVHGHGQEEVARRLSISRSKVTRLLGQAREFGIVKISIEHETVETLALADWIAATYGIRDCILTPWNLAGSADPATSDRLGRQAVGIAAANHLSRRLLAMGPAVLGLGWGRTVGEMITAFPMMSKPDARVVAILGASSRDDGYGSYSLTLRFAAALGGEAVTLPIPMVTASPALSEALRRDAGVTEVLSMAASADMIILGCNDCSDDNAYFRAARLGEAERQAIVDSGAVCEVAGLFLDAEGRLAPTDLNDRGTGIGLDVLKRAECVILAASRRKAAPLRALIKAGIAKTIVIDTEIAEDLATPERRAGMSAPA